MTQWDAHRLVGHEKRGPRPVVEIGVDGDLGEAPAMVDALDVAEVILAVPINNDIVTYGYSHSTFPSDHSTRVP